MTQTEEEVKKNLKKMMQDSYLQDDLYTAGNYWKYYEKKILNQINNNSLKRFRSWEGGTGSGNIQSFGGGDELLGRSFKRNFHPLDNSFRFFDNFYFVQKYNSLINKILPYLPMLKFFLIRIAEVRKYFKDIHEARLKEKYELIKKIDKDLVKISDSSFGIDNDKLISIEGKNYTNRFLKTLLHISELKKNTKFESINYVLELGAGIGLFASAFLKLNKKTKYLILDIPPTIIFSQYFLSNIGYKVYGYEEIRKEKNIDIKKIFENYDVICLPTWKIEDLKDFKFDLFVNIYSFQEMEKKQCLNYLSVLKKNLRKYIYIENLISGHTKTKKKNSFGVLDQSNLQDIESSLSTEYKTLKKELNISNQSYNIIFEKINDV